MGRLSRLVGAQAPVVGAPQVKTAGAKSADFDPRPDLVEDHRDWMAVLAAAQQDDKELFGLLHGLRCGGARLEVRVTSQGRPYYKLDYSALLSVWKEDELRRRWLEPMRARIKAALDRGLHIKTDVEREMAVQSTRAAVG